MVSDDNDASFHAIQQLIANLTVSLGKLHLLKKTEETGCLKKNVITLQLEFE